MAVLQPPLLGLSKQQHPSAHSPGAGVCLLPTNCCCRCAGNFEDPEEDRDAVPDFLLQRRPSIVRTGTHQHAGEASGGDAGGRLHALQIVRQTACWVHQSPLEQAVKPLPAIYTLDCADHAVADQAKPRSIFR